MGPTYVCPGVVSGVSQQFTWLDGILGTSDAFYLLHLEALQQPGTLWSYWLLFSAPQVGHLLAFLHSFPYWATNVLQTCLHSVINKQEYEWPWLLSWTGSTRSAAPIWQTNFCWQADLPPIWGQRLLKDRKPWISSSLCYQITGKMLQALTWFQHGVCVRRAVMISKHY